MAIKILDLLLPREIAFFKYFNEQIDLFRSACESFKKLISEINSLSQDEIHNLVIDIKQYELDEDELERAIIDKLHHTFITPIDREDIHQLVISIGNSMDLLNDVAQKIEKYQISEITPNVVKFVGIITNMSKELHTLINSLHKKKDLMPSIKKIHFLENEADALVHMSMAELFKTDNPIYIIKFKDIYEHLEAIVNSMDDIAKLIRGIIVKWV